MRRIARLSVNSENREELQYLFNGVKESLLESEMHDWYLTVVLDEETEAYRFLMGEIKQRNLKYSFNEGREYTKTEIKNAEFFWVKFWYPWQHNPKTAEEYGTKYSENDICPTCRKGGTQISELIVDLKKVIKERVASINPEIMVSGNIREEIEKAKLSGVHFGEARDHKNREMPIFHQLFIDSVLPPMSSTIIIETEDATRCKTCNRGGIYLRSEAIYDRINLNHANDFNLTQEYFFSANYCMKQIIVSAKACKLLKSCKAGFWEEPVTIL